MNLNDLNELKQTLKEAAFGNERPKAGCCISCKQPFSDVNVFTDAGWRETKISGMCEACFDDIFKDEEE